MPLVIAVQSSLSLLEQLSLCDAPEVEGKKRECQRLEAVKSVVRWLIGHLGVGVKLDSIAVVTYGATHEVLVPFTRDAQAIEASLSNISWKEGNSFEAGLHGVRQILSEINSETCSPLSRAIFITDGHIGPLTRPVLDQLLTDCGEDLAKVKANYKAATTTDVALRGFASGGKSPIVLQGSSSSSCSSPRGQDFPLAFPFPCRLHFLSICDKDEGEVCASCLKGKAIMEKIVDWNLGAGSYHEVSPLEGLPVMKAKLEEIFKQLLPEYRATLKCGKMSERVTLLPPPEIEMPKKLLILGFLKLSDVGSPAIVSRHVVHAVPSEKDGQKKSSKKSAKKTKEDEPEEDETKIPSFCMLLYQSLQGTGTAAIVRLRLRRFGIMYANFIDAKKKKPGLIMSIFHRGSKPIPWLANFHFLAPAQEVVEFGTPQESPASPDGSEDVMDLDDDREEGEARDDDDEDEDGDDDEEDEDAELEADAAGKEDAEEESDGDDCSDLPLIYPKLKPSYAMGANFYIWTDESSVECDMLKVIRFARKVPEKTSVFYRELNRVRKSAVSYGFETVLTALAFSLEREAQALSQSAHAEAILQLSHAAACLRDHPYEPVMPMDTKFQQRGGR